jgi:hypothetical protein
MSENRNQSTDREQDLADSPGVMVECYAGYRAEETPRRFYIGKREIGVVEVIDRWLDPEHSYFKVRGEDGGIYILRYRQHGDIWEMILFDSDTREDTRLSST